MKCELLCQWMDSGPGGGGLSPPGHPTQTRCQVPTGKGGQVELAVGWGGHSKGEGLGRWLL